MKTLQAITCSSNCGAGKELKTNKQKEKYREEGSGIIKSSANNSSTRTVPEAYKVELAKVRTILNKKMWQVNEVVVGRWWKSAVRREVSSPSKTCANFGPNYLKL